MEDRLTSGLYLELTNADPDEYAARADGLAAQPSVTRVSWWANCQPDRGDLGRRVPEGTLLGVAEVADGFSAPDAFAGATAHHFRRFGRPSQGVLTGRPTTGLLLVWISPRTPALARRLRDWADFVHIRHIAAAGVPGYTQITPFVHVGGGDPLFMHLYEMDGEDPEATFRSMRPLVASRLGGEDTDAYRDWADLRAAGGRLYYCNTFRLLGAVGER